MKRSGDALEPPHKRTTPPPADAADDDSATDSTEVDDALDETTPPAPPQDEWFSLRDMGFPRYEATAGGSVRRHATRGNMVPMMRAGRQYVNLRSDGVVHLVGVARIADHVRRDRAGSAPTVDADGREWRRLDAHGYPGFEVSRDGGVRSTTTGNEMRVRDGAVRMSIDGVRVSAPLHRLLGLAFPGRVPPPPPPVANPARSKQGLAAPKGRMVSVKLARPLISPAPVAQPVEVVGSDAQWRHLGVPTLMVSDRGECATSTGRTIFPWKRPGDERLWVHWHGSSYPLDDLVARAFFGLPPPGARLEHMDGNESNNALTNLCYAGAMPPPTC